ncbi:MAG: hypothetical protein M3Q45_15195 [Chloroflexota bacterium]|nr:hypothetical protein [Chloroflexota bacterium]
MASIKRRRLWVGVIVLLVVLSLFLSWSGFNRFTAWFISSWFVLLAILAIPFVYKTTLHQAQTRLREQQTLAQTILDHSPNLMTIKDRAGRYVHVNAVLTKLFCNKASIFSGTMPLIAKLLC